MSTLEKGGETPLPEQEDKGPTTADLERKITEFMQLRENSGQGFKEELERLLEYEKGVRDEKREVEFPGWGDEDIEALRNRLLQLAYGEDEKGQ